MQSRSDNGADVGRRALLTLAAIAPVFAVGTTSPAEASPTAAKLPPDLAKTMNDYYQATLRNDIAALGKVVAEDYLLVNSDTTLQDKQQYLSDFTTPGFRLEPYVIEQPMQKVWGDTALTGGLWHLSWQQEGVRNSRLLRLAHVWAKYDGRWLLTYTQLTRVPQ